MESSQDIALFRRLPAFGGIEVADAHFIHHYFVPHTHDELTIGVLRSGLKQFTRGRTAHVVGRRGLSVINPGDVHAGGPAQGQTLRYTALYLGADVLQRAGLPAAADIASAVLADPEIFQALCHVIDTRTDPLQAEELLVDALALLASRYAAAGAARSCGTISHPALRRATEFIDAHLDEALTLDRLAEAAGLGTRHLMRCFQQATGLGPHAYLRQCRIRRACDRLRRGASIADTAYATGFSDQAHFTKAFKLLTGTTPGRYAASLAG